MVELNEKAFTQYRRKQIAELRPWREGDDMAGISVSREDVSAGSPRPGDMIARNPKNHADQWLVAAAYFADNFEPATARPAHGDGLVDRLQIAADGVEKVSFERLSLRRGYEKVLRDAATALQSKDEQIERLTRERDEARHIVRETHWMAVRYADGRKSYAPGMCNDALRKAYDAGWLTYQQHTPDPQYAREGDKPEYGSLEARAEAAEQQVQKLTAENERLRAALEAAAIALDEAAIEVQSWGAYASEYFQDKHDLEGCCDEIAKQAGAARSALEQEGGK